MKRGPMCRSAADIRPFKLALHPTEATSARSTQIKSLQWRRDKETLFMMHVLVLLGVGEYCASVQRGLHYIACKLLVEVSRVSVVYTCNGSIG